MVCPTSPTWGRWGKGRGFVPWNLYFAPYMGQNFRVFSSSTPAELNSNCLFSSHFTHVALREGKLTLNVGDSI